MKIQENVCTENRNLQERSAKRKRSEGMIRVHVEAVKNIKSAVEETHK